MKSASFLLLNESIEPGGKRHLIQLVFSVNVRKEVPELNLNEKAITGFGYFLRRQFVKWILGQTLNPSF